MSARIFFTLLGIQGVKRKFALGKALRWLLVWWFPCIFSSVWSRLFPQAEQGMREAVVCCSLVLPPSSPFKQFWDFMSHIKCHPLHWAGGTVSVQIPGKNTNFFVFLSMNFASSISELVVPPCLWLSHLVVVRWSLTGRCRGVSRFTPDHRISGNCRDFRSEMTDWMLTGAHLRDQYLVFSVPLKTGATGLCQGSEDFQCSHSQGQQKLPSITKDNSPLSPLPGETFPSSQKRSSWKHPTLNASYGRLKAFTGNLLQRSGGQLSTLCGL